MRMIAPVMCCLARGNELRPAGWVELVQVGEETLPADCEESIPSAGPPLAIDVFQGQGAGEVLGRRVKIVACRLESGRPPRPGAVMWVCHNGLDQAVTASWVVVASGRTRRLCWMRSTIHAVISDSTQPTC